MTLLESGAHVRLLGLKGRPELNGEIGRLGPFDDGSGRWTVHLDKGEDVKIKPENLEAAPSTSESPPISSTAPALLLERGARVSLIGLAGRAELNGQLGILEVNDPTSGRWFVRLDSGEMLKIKPSNLAEAEPDPAKDAHSAWVYNARAQGPLKATDLKMVYISAPEPLEANEVLFQVLYFGIDAGTHPRMRNHSTWSEGASLEAAALMNWAGIARAIESKNPRWAVGDVVYGSPGIARRFFKADPDDISSGIRKVTLEPGLKSIRDHLHLLAPHTGWTAWLPIKNYGIPKGGEVVYVTAAAGAVGLVVGQIYALHGCTVFGSTGSEEKIELIKSYGYKDGFNYKTTSLQEGLSRLAPDGIDIFFDNVGGKFFEQTLPHMKNGGQCVKCGSVSQYDLDERYNTDARLVEVKSLRLDNFASSGVYQWFHQGKEASEQLMQWIQEGKLRIEETIFSWEEYGDAYLALLSGKNIGKVIVRCPQPEGFEEL